MPACKPDAGSKKLVFVFVEALFRRKSCVTAMPIEAKAREVRIQARKVRSVGKGVGVRGVYACFKYRLRVHIVPNARWSRATLPLFSSSRLPYRSANRLYQD